jgi:hypothetical protein
MYRDRTGDGAQDGFFAMNSLLHQGFDALEQRPVLAHDQQALGLTCSSSSNSNLLFLQQIIRDFLCKLSLPTNPLSHLVRSNVPIQDLVLDFLAKLS